MLVCGSATIKQMSLITNRKAGFNYEFLEKYTAGIELFGYEVKSLKESHGSIEGAHITVRGGEAFIVGMFIPPYQQNNTPKDYDPYRTRRLLLNKEEIVKIAKTEATKGLTIVPISVYNSNGKIKLEIAEVRGKKKFDKRETLKKKDSLRDVARELKDR